MAIINIVDHSSLEEAVACLQTELNRADRTAASRLRAGTAEDLQILRAILGEGPMRVGALAEARGASPATVSARLDRLERRGLIERERIVDDRRGVVAVLTEAGARAAASSRQQRLDALGAVSDDFPVDALTALTDALAAHRDRDTDTAATK